MEVREPSKIGLIDVDGTVADYDRAMREDMARLAAPGAKGQIEGNDPHLKARRRMIKNQPGFWRDLPRIDLGFQIVEELEKNDFSLHILTKGPTTTTSAWTEKVQWAQRHLPKAAITITQDKSLVYGRVLVDDWPAYFMPWLEMRPRGLVICVAQPWNLEVDHPRVLRYDGRNYKEMKRRVQLAGENVT